MGAFIVVVLVVQGVFVVVLMVGGHSFKRNAPSDICSCRRGDRVASEDLEVEHEEHLRFIFPRACVGISLLQDSQGEVLHAFLGSVSHGKVVEDACLVVEHRHLQEVPVFGLQLVVYALLHSVVQVKSHSEDLLAFLAQASADQRATYGQIEPNAPRIATRAQFFDDFDIVGNCDSNGPQKEKGSRSLPRRVGREHVASGCLGAIFPVKAEGRFSRAGVLSVVCNSFHRDGRSLDEKLKSWKHVSCLKVSDGSVVELDRNSVHFSRQVL
jgi:hypothetical protein